MAQSIEEVLAAIRALSGTSAEVEMPAQLMRAAGEAAIMDARLARDRAQAMQRLQLEAARRRMLEEQAKRLVGTGMREGRLNSVTQAILNRLEDKEFEPVSGKARAAALRQRLEAAAETAAVATLAREQPRWRSAGIKMPENMLDELKQRYHEGGNIEQWASNRRAEAYQRQRQAAKLGKAARRLETRYGATPMEAAGMAKQVEAGEPMGSAFQRVLKGVEERKAGEAAAKSAASRSKLKWGGIGGVALAALLLPKILGGKKQETAVPPEYQMMMLQQMMGRGTKPQDASIGTGRELLNMSRALGIIKMLQDLQQTQAQPDVRRMI